MFKKTITTALAVVVCSFSLKARDIYVSPTGNDANSGLISSPYASLSKAASEAQAGDTVYLRAGTYEETLRPARSGTAQAPIIFQAYKQEKVIVSAMESLSGWASDGGSVYKTSVSWDLGQDNFVMQGNKVMDLARWPNNVDGEPFTTDTVRNTGGTGPNVVDGAYLDFNPSDINARFPNLDWKNGGSIYFYGDKPGAGWLAYKELITASNATRITFDVKKNHSWILNFHSPRDLGNFYLEGIREALDFENEWYFDTATKHLFVQLPNGSKPNNGQVKMRRRINTIDLSDRSYVHINNIAVFGGTINLDGQAKFNRLVGVSSFYGNHTRGIFRDFASTSRSVYFGYNSSDNILEHSEIAFGAGSGVVDNGDRNQVRNSYIHDFNILGSYDAPMVIRGGENAVVYQNTITRGGRDAVQAANVGLEFSYNDVSRSNLIADDCALFYSVGGPYNNEIHHNWFHDAYASGSRKKAAGIYLDNDPHSFSVHHNVVWNTEWSNIQMNWDATNIDVFNNTFVNGEQTMGAWHKTGTAFSDVRVWNNLSDQNQWEPQSDKQNNVTYSGSPFIDQTKGDFRLKPNDTEAINKGRSIASITSNVTDGAPDVGAYEVGESWVAGVNWDITKGAANRCYDLPGEQCQETPSSPDQLCLPISMKNGRVTMVCL